MPTEDYRCNDCGGKDIDQGFYRPFKLAPEAKKKMSEYSAQVRDQNEQEIFGPNWQEPVTDPKKVRHWEKTPPGADGWTHHNHEGW